jgi:hypothetical protein
VLCACLAEAQDGIWSEGWDSALNVVAYAIAGASVLSKAACHSSATRWNADATNRIFSRIISSPEALVSTTLVERSPQLLQRTVKVRPSSERPTTSVL